MKGMGGDKQLRLYVTRASAAQEVLAPAGEFFRDKDNTVFASIPTICPRTAGTTTLQFSIAEGARHRSLAEEQSGGADRAGK